MAFNPYLIPRKTKDIGTASSLMDISRRLKSVEGKYGYVGSGATVTAPTIQTSDTVPKVALNAFGLQIYDGSGNVPISLGITGILIQKGTGTINSVAWYSGASPIGQVYGDSVVGPANFMKTQVNFGASSAWLNVIYGIGGFTIGANSTGGVGVTICDSSGNGFWAGNISANSFITTSDRNAKEQIESISSDTAALLYRLNPVSYVHKDSQEPLMGFVAQEVQEHLPNAVKTIKQVVPHGDEETQPPSQLGLHADSILALAVKCIQDLQSKVGQLENEVALLKGEPCK